MENENKNIVVGEDGSYFDGGYWANIGYTLVVNFVTFITFGIAHPWMRCWYQKWLCEHTVINGKRMTFDGKGGDLFVKYIIWLLLSYLTCGIYGLWMAVALKKWITEHTFFEGEPDNNSFFDGKVGDYFVTSILSALALFVPFAGPAWSKIIMTRWFINHTVIDSRRLTFRGTVGDLFLKYLLWGLLTTVTCGIFAWFVPVKYIKWETEHTLDENCTPEALNAKANYKTQVHTDAVMLQSGDGAQLENIKAQMLKEANEGIEENNLEKLNNALRFADILKECGNKFGEKEIKLIYNCELLARKLKAEKPIATKSKVGIIVVAIIAAFVMLIGIVFGAICVGALLMKRTGFEGPAMSNGVVDYVDVSSMTFESKLSEKAEAQGYNVTEIATGVGEKVLELKNNYHLNSSVEIYVVTELGNIDEVEISGNRMIGFYDNQNDIKYAIKCVYYSLGLGEIDDIKPNIDTDSTITCGAWDFEYTQNDTEVTVKITKN
ncbi:MAG: DUF898 family protein [Clostridia bacterium]|nr:DUF898 family protein [Clostridia bacterium]